MRSVLHLGPVNLALISIYFVPVWGRDAVRALVSPFGGMEDRAHAAATAYFLDFIDLGIGGLMVLSNVLAGVKLVVAAGFVAYLIDFARAIATRQAPNRETADAVLALAAIAILLLALPALTVDDPALVRVYATQLLLVSGAVIVVMVERGLEQEFDIATPIATASSGERPTAANAIP